MVFDDHIDSSSDKSSERSRLDAAQGNRVLLLTRDAGFVELADLHFGYADGPILFGARDELLSEWRGKLSGENTPQ